MPVYPASLQACAISFPVEPAQALASLVCRWVSYKYGYSFLRFSRTVIGTLPLKIFENSIACLQKRCKEGKKILNGLDKTIQNAAIATPIAKSRQAREVWFYVMSGGALLKIAVMEIARIVG